MTNRLLALLIEFDEMGFSPTTVCEDPEGHAVKWKELLLEEIKALESDNVSLRNEADENAALSMENKMRADRLEKENAALRERLEKAVGLTVKECLRILHNIGGCDATDDFSRGWDEAINTAFKEISEKYGVSEEEVFDDECPLAELKGGEK